MQIQKLELSPKNDPRSNACLITGGRTKLTVQSVFQSIANRDGIIQSGIDTRVNESYECHDALLMKMEKGL